MGRIFSAWEHESALIKTYLNKNISIVCEEVKLLTVGKGYKVSFGFMCKTCGTFKLFVLFCSLLSTLFIF